MKKRKLVHTVLAVLIVCAICFSFAPQSMALTAVTASFAGISSYSNCTYGNRAGKQYVENFDSELQDLADSGRINYTRINLLTDNQVTTASISTEAEKTTTIFVYSGHGLSYDTSNNSLHVNGSLSHASLSNTHFNPSVNLKTTDTTFDSKYVVLYSCNQLTNGGSATKGANILNMMNGTRLMFGFASSMFLDSRDATTFVYRMGWVSNMIDAYMFSSEYYQAQHPSIDVIARVVGYADAFDDNIRVYESYAPAAESSPADFDILESVTIPHLGYLP